LSRKKIYVEKMNDVLHKKDESFRLKEMANRNFTKGRGKMKKIGLLLFGLMFVIGVVSAAAQTEPKPFEIGGTTFKRVHHDENLLPDRGHSGFGSLLFDTNGKLVMEADDTTWLYTTGLFEAPTGGQRDWYGKWVSHVRKFNPKTWVSGEKQWALGLAAGDQWAVIHHAIQVDEDLYLVFYSANAGVRTAIADKPDGQFTAIPDFQLTVTEPREEEGGKRSGAAFARVNK
jgi:hypothetical protein